MKLTNIYLTLPLVLIIALSLFVFDKDKEEIAYQYGYVKNRDINMTLFLRGEVEASKFVQIASPIISNRAKIVYLIEEGSVVKQGDIIAKFDTKPFEDDHLKWVTKEKEAQNVFINAQKELEIQLSKNQQLYEKAKAILEIDKLKYDDIQKGEGLIRLNELKQKVTQAKRKVELEKMENDDYKMLLKKGYISNHEYTQSSDTLLEAQENLNIAYEKLQHYKNYKWPKLLKEQKIRINEHTINLLATKKQNALNLETKKAQHSKAESTLIQSRNELKKVEKNLQNCIVRAPVNGVLLYKKITKNTKASKVAIGDSIWFKQSFLQIPDTKKMIVRTSVLETDLLRVKKGSQATVVLDHDISTKHSALVRYVSTVNSENDQQRARSFETVLEIQDSDIIYSGISATVAIVYDQKRNVLSVPSEAVYEKELKKYVTLKQGSSYVEKEISIGAIGDRYIEVTRGLSDGEIVAYR